MHPFKAAMSVTALMALTAPAFAQEVNLYSSRHYDSDDALYAAFTEKTGITINRIEAKADELMARMEAEGANSPADVFMTVDVGRISRAEERGLLQPFESQTIEANVPAHLRDDENLWTGLSQRARIIFYSKERVDNPPRTYEDLADPAYKGQICIRSSSNIYNQSLMAAIIETHGEDVARGWPRASSPTWRASRRAATPTSFAASSRASATSPWPTPITMPAAWHVTWTG